MEKKKIKTNVATGLSSTAGATIGVVAGSVVSPDASAAENDNLEENVAVEESAGRSRQHHSNSDSESKPDSPTNNESQEPLKIEQEDGEVVNTGSTTTNNDTNQVQNTDDTPEIQDPSWTPEKPEVEVLSYETIEGEDGSQMDVAVLSVDGENVGLADFDQDGMADVMVMDLNQNEVIEENEILDISEQNLDMSNFKSESEMPVTDDMAYNNEPDYYNDANVDEYMA